MKPLRCLRCGGNIFTEPDAGGIIIDLKCMACGRSPGEYIGVSTRNYQPEQQFRHKVATQEHVDLARRGCYPLWITSAKQRRTQ